MVYRVYVEKKPEFAVEAAALREELRTLLGLSGLTGVRVVQRYDVEGIGPDLFDECLHTVFSEPPVDRILPGPPRSGAVFAAEYLPGQFDQRADSAAECIQLLSRTVRPAVRSARVYVLEGAVSPGELERAKQYLINPVEAREAAMEKPASLLEDFPTPPPVPVLEGFLALPPAGMAAFIEEYGLAMDEDDLAFCQAYFQKEGRAPTLTELRMIDTYWSDHCRHTTFGTQLDTIDIEDEAVLRSYRLYHELRSEVYGNAAAGRPETLMDMATIGMKALKKRGLLPRLDESEEINACSVNIQVDNGGRAEDWLLLFKNETHNHPTEIEPFGGAATCLGGAIRDPLSGRGYVYGAMRVTGGGNPLAPVAETLPGKLPQRTIVTTAAAGYASYGNQIGLATGQVSELYHPGYVAKRMEIGAVLGAAPRAHVRREAPRPGDAVILLGGRTGRDGCGGATGSSKAHKASSLATCGAEVQKGNPPVERALQRLFRRPEATRLVLRCNDFGAGGVAVAIGELADGLRICLDAVPKKYDGLDGTELAISESQERMAVVVAPEDADAFIRLAQEENLEATRVAEVTAEPRLVMEWNGDVIVDIARTFLDSNGAQKHAEALVGPLPAPDFAPPAGETLAARLTALASSLSFCCQKGLVERFDSTIGAGTVLMPFGGKHQLTPAQALVMKLPVPGETTTCSGMAFGFDPFLSEQNPYEGAYLAVVESVCKLVASGFSHKNIHLTFQEYFERLRREPARWGKPVAALLGALQAQMDLGLASIGGKDSMSGSFEDMDVPPTLVSFAVADGSTRTIVSPEFELPGSRVVWLRPAGAQGLLPNAAAFKLLLAQVEELVRSGKVLAAWAPGRGGVAEALFKMGLGNRIGFSLAPGFDTTRLFAPAFGSFVLELAEPLDIGEVLGETAARYALAAAGETVDLAAVQAAWETTLEPVLPWRGPSPEGGAPALAYTAEDGERRAPKVGAARPRVLIPVFPGTNCETDTARALRRAGAEPEIFILRNLTPADVADSAARLASRLDACQMLVLPGGFSGGDEPDGSAKLITSFLRGPAVAGALTRLLDERDGLVLGICNGFQALVKLGLVPFGKITPPAADMPTLTFNAVGRHQSVLVRTRVASNLSPWLMHEEPGSVHLLPVSNGEGRFVASPEALDDFARNGQIATQYADFAGAPSLDIRHNPSGSVWAVEGLSSPDGRVLGKMAHSERYGDVLYKNVPGEKFQRLFEGGVDYFKVL